MQRLHIFTGRYIVPLILFFIPFIQAMHIVALSGSLRKASCNTGVLRAMAKMLPPGHTMDIIVPGDLPLFNQDLEHPDLYPEAVKEYRNRLRVADCFLFSLPEYNYGLSGTYYNMLQCIDINI